MRVLAGFSGTINRNTIRARRRLRSVSIVGFLAAAIPRSRAIQEAVEDKLARLDRSRLGRECGTLDPRAEQFFGWRVIPPNSPNTERRDQR